MNDKIILKNISQNNLKNISLEIPKNQLIVVTGVSGSGKSSLAFDVINKEGQRRYFTNFSAQARKYLGKLQKSDVESIENLNPTISLSQKTKNNNPRSTVGTISEIYDYLRLLFARVGKSHLKELKINRSLFSFNSLSGACLHCKGLGLEDIISPELLVEDATKTIRNQALRITNPNGYTIYSQVTIDALNEVCVAHGFNVDIPWQNLTEEQKNIVLNGSDKIKILYGKHTLESRMKWSGITVKPREKSIYKGILPVMNEILQRDRNPNILRFAKTQKCSYCHGKRLSAEALSVKILDKNISELSDFSLDELSEFISKMKNFAKIQNLGKVKLLNEISIAILQRIESLQELGLSYLSLSRSASSLSGGETQRIRLAGQVNSKLQNIVFVFDEPSIGVHLSNNQNILKIIRKLVSNGNTAIIVEHDAQTILSADWIIDIGPKAGKNGGELLFNGKLQRFLLSEHQSITKDYLNKKKEIKLNLKLPAQAEYFSVKNAEINNLKNISVDFKYGSLNVVCGVSGAGKSSLINQSLIPLIRGEYKKQINAIGNPILQNFQFKKTIIVNQSPIGKTARSTPATYTKLHDLIRNFYANLEESKKRKFTKSTFSFNVKSGSCQKCGGAGKLEIGMHFLGNVETTCDACNGKRYQSDVLGVKFNDKNISDVLDLSVKEAILFFDSEKKILKSLQILDKIGLGYIKLGQSSNSLSGGEAQRIKLATELIKANSSQTLFVFDEPTTGLHFYDIQILMDLFAELLKKGNTIIVIEHNEDFIKNAQHLIELGTIFTKFTKQNLGGELIYSGNFEGFENCNSKTAKAIKELSGFQKLSAQNITAQNEISFKGISTNNLKNIDVQIPYNQHTVIVGKSGSGKSSLAFDTLFVEAQNRFTESFPTYARQFATYNSKAKFEQVSGLTPVIALRQNNKINDSRSTLATLTEIYDSYRLLFSRFGTAFCVDCGDELVENYCKKCDKQFIKTNTASVFSFNNSEGSCSECSGLGKVLTSSALKLVVNWNLPFGEGALKKNKTIRFFTDKNGQYIATLLEVGKQFGIDYSQSINKLSKEALSKAFFGTAEKEYEVEWKFKAKTTKGTHSFSGKWIGFVQLILDEYFQKQANGKGADLLDFLHEKECPKCKGQKYKKDILSVKFNSINIFELSQKSVAESIVFFSETLTLPKFTQLNNFNRNKNAENLQTLTLAKLSLKPNSQLIENILQKLNALKSFGLEYLSLNRFSKTLSGGELQRVLLSTHLTGSLTGITYILDEPSTGLHLLDIEILSENINKIVKLGNTVVTVEHNSEIIKSADNIIEIGYEAGENGGELIYSGSLDGFKQTKVEKIEYNFKIVDNSSKFLKINSAKANNLKNIDVKIALNALNVISGVSGSGKTSLMRDVLLETFHAKAPQFCESIENLKELNSVVWIDKNGLEKNTISTPVTFLGVFDEIRKLFAQTTSAKAEKLKASDFSYNGKSGQCPICKGQGEIKHSLDFMSDVKTVCEECSGKRFKSEILEISYKNKSIFDVLEMSILEALNFFHENTKIRNILEITERFGLAYIKLGQRSQELSGGESQRFKIVKELIKSNIGTNLYIFDEASRGLHPSDLKYLLASFEYLLKKGNTIVAIEHNMNMIANASWIIDLGLGGGKLVFQGVLSDFLNCKESKTAKYLKKTLV